MTFDLRMSDTGDILEPRIWRSILATTLAKSNEGIVVCDVDLRVVYMSPRAATLLQRFGSSKRDLPDLVVEHARAQLAGAEEDRVERLRAVRGESAVYMRVARLSTPVAHTAHAVIWLREEILRDEALYAAVQSRFAVSRRGFQLLQLVRKGLTNRQIAEHLRLTESTVKGYLHELYRACGVSSRTALLALVDGLVA